MTGFPMVISAAMAILRGRYPRRYATLEVLDYVRARRIRTLNANLHKVHHDH